MKETVTALVIMTVIVSSAAVCGIILVNNDILDIGIDDPTTYSITYVMNDGTNSADNPSRYTEGTETELKEPTRERYVFIGWYTDAELTNEITSISKDSKGDITLYAGWEESEIGKVMTFTISGTVKNKTGPLTQTVSTIDGTISFTYLHYRYSKGYLMERNQTLTVTSGLTSDTEYDNSSYWSGDNDTVWIEGNIRTIETAFGTKECQTWISRDADSTETQYVAEDGITYLIEYVSTQKNIVNSTTTSITYTLSEIGTAVLADDFDVIAYCDKDISVSGTGRHTAYEDVTLTAYGDSFSGWYDESGTLLSKKRIYTIDKFVSDTVVYARNSNEADVISDDYTSTISPSVQLTGVTWTFTDVTEYVITGDTLTHTFSSPGSYTILYTGTMTDGSTYHGLLDLLIDYYVTKTYDWTYSGQHYQIVSEIKYSDYLAYREDSTATRHQVDNEHDSVYFTINDPYIGYIASRLEQFAEGHDPVWKANLILSFVQSTDYVTDQNSRGKDEYWKYPLETLYDMGGDCEDTSFLFATIAKRMGYDCCTIIFSGHMAAGIILDGGSGYSYTFDSKDYYYCETTSDTWTIGHQPDDNYKQDHVIRYIPAP